MKGLYVQTFGCQMNVSDSDRMKAVLAPLGYREVGKPHEADLVLINTCSIREKAEEKASSFAENLKNLKESNPSLRIGITGCVAQQEKDKIIEEHPFVDLVMGPDNIDELPWALEELSHKAGKQLVRAEFESDARVWKTETRLLKPGPTAFISIMKGCDHFCAYCVVPYTRGREKSRPMDDVVADVESLVARGVKEVTFLGQNINTYGKRSGSDSLHALFRRVHEIEGLKRIRFTTSHPGDLTDELVRCFEDLPRLCSAFHLPVQSGSTRVLRSMRRFYTREQYLERARALRQARPDIALSTDIIVGYPGETDADFEETMSLIEEVPYENSYSFTFSARPGTSAAGRGDSVPETVKLARLARLQERLRWHSLALHKAEVGRVREVLIEGPSKRRPEILTGRTTHNTTVHVDPSEWPSEPKAGDIIEVLITEGHQGWLRGQPPAAHASRAGESREDSVHEARA